MNTQFFAAVSLLSAGLFIGVSSGAQQQSSTRDLAQQSSQASATSNVPQRSGEASTMTDGVPNLSASNPQPGELGIQTRLTVRKAPAQAAVVGVVPELTTMGAAPLSSSVAAQAAQPQSQGGTPD